MIRETDKALNTTQTNIDTDIDTVTYRDQDTNGDTDADKGKFQHV